MATIAIVGAGLIGRLMTLQLTDLGHTVSLFDKDNAQGKQSAAFTAAGLLTPYGESLGAESLIVEMGLAALHKWPTLLAKLSEPVEFKHTGSICVSHQQDIGDYQRFCQHIERYYPQSELTRLSHDHLAKLEPNLAERFQGGAFIPNEGVINNHQLLLALHKYLSECTKLTWFENINITQIKPNSVTTEKGDTYTADMVIDTRGTGSDIKNLRPVRGEVIYLHAPAVKITRPIRLMHPRYKLYIAPKADQHYAIGATEIESGDYKPITVQSSLELLSAIYSLHPGFAEASIIHQLSNCRPAFHNNLPRIYSQTGLMQINGLYRHGYLLAPEIVDIAIAQIQLQLNEVTINESKTWDTELC